MISDVVDNMHKQERNFSKEIKTITKNKIKIL